MHRPFRFGPPPIAPVAVTRPRLLRALAARFESRLLTIEAGAGLGKTTVLHQAVTENLLSPLGVDCWLTCEPADASPSTLLGALLVALGQPVPRRAASAADVCEAVWAKAPTEVCLVLDDCHLIDIGSPGEAALQELLGSLPGNGHLLVAGRRLPRLSRSRLGVQGLARELGESDLLLDDDELAALAARHGIDASRLGSAGGWPALAELLARSGVGQAERFAWDEVLEPLPEPERRAFLLVTAVGGAGRDALDAVADAPFQPDLVCALPLVTSDGRGGVWPHPLWTDLVSTHLDATDVAAARRRFADFLRAGGEHGAAFEMLAAAGEWDQAVDAVFDACNDQRAPPWRDLMERWRAILPDDVAPCPEVEYLVP